VAASFLNRGGMSSMVPSLVRDRREALLLMVQLLEPVAVGEDLGSTDAPACAAPVERDPP